MSVHGYNLPLCMRLRRSGILRSKEDHALANNMYVQYTRCLSMKVLNHIEPRDSLQYLGKHY